MSFVQPLSDDQLCAAVQAETQIQTAVHSPTVQPLARVAFAPKLAKAPAGIDDPIWADVPIVGKLINSRPADGLTADTEARAACDEHALYVRIVNRGKPARRSYKREFWMIDTNEITIDPTHDHFNYFQFVILPDGIRKSSKGWKSCGSQRWEIRGKMNELPIDQWSGTAQIGEDNWATQFTIPFSTLGVRPEEGRPFGFNCMRQRCDVPWEHHYWNFTHRGFHSPFGFGDLYLNAPPRIHVEKIDLGELKLWENRGALFIRNCSGKSISGRMEVTVSTGPKEEHTFYSGSIKTEIPGATSEPFRLPFVFPFDPREFKYQHLHVTLRDESGVQLWTGTYRGAYEHGWMLHLDDRREGPPVENPGPADPDFIDKKRAWLIRKLPKFIRKTTAQGAPSDFTLEASDGSVVFNLMRAGALKEIADYIYSRFDNDLDRLLGATMFVHQPAVIRYAHVPTQLAGCLSPLSIMRMGNAMCSSQAEALCGIIEKMKCEATGKTYRARTVTFFAHVVTVAEFKGRWVHLDGSLGRFYFLPGNTELATMEELIAKPELGGQQSGNLEEMFRKTAGSDLPFYSYTNPGVWPPGAPVE
jgi:hypothetical protein